MPWLQVHIDAHQAQVETIEALLGELGALSVTLGDAADEPLLEPAPGTTPLWQRTRVTGLFDAGTDPAWLRTSLRRRLAADTAAGARLETLADQPWERRWLAHCRPMAFGRLWVIPDGSPPPQPDAINLMLEPGLAFGTGSHATTAACLSWLAQQPLSGRRVVDFGCGSGILAIAAALLGAQRVFAYDHDPQALTATRRNAERNGVAGRIEIHREAPSGAAAAACQADVVIANILANTLIELAPSIGALVAADGRLALAGVLAGQVDDVRAAYARSFHFDAPATCDGWSLLTASRTA